MRILVVLAHPDDPEFFCGATLARWTRAGHEVIYRLLTCGDKGAPSRLTGPDELCGIRQIEQKAAAAVLGVHQIHFLGFPDGYLVADLELRRAVTRAIREVRPDILVTCDPQNLFVGDSRINHPDHRAAGQAAIDAVFPAAGNHLFFPELLDDGLEPHSVKEVWVSGTQQANTFIDVTDLWDTKIQAILEHKSQIPDRAGLVERMRSRLAPGATLEEPRYEEGFRRMIIG